MGRPGGGEAAQKEAEAVGDGDGDGDEGKSIALGTERGKSVGGGGQRADALKQQQQQEEATSGTLPFGTAYHVPVVCKEVSSPWNIL